MIEILKNPIIIGLIAGILTYLYLYWNEEQRYKSVLRRSKKKPVSILTPGLVAIISWFVASSYLDHKSSSTLVTNSIQKSNKMVSVDSVSDGLHKIQTNNIRLPQSDVFIDLAKF